MSTTQKSENKNLNVKILTKDYAWSPQMLPRGKYNGLVCAESGKEIHHSYKPEERGFLSYKKQMWFASPFDNNLHSWKNHISPYDDPSYRASNQIFFKDYLNENVTSKTYL
jgi:hypothetical protein